MTNEQVIDSMTYPDLLFLFRYAPTGCSLFTGETGKQYTDAMRREADSLTASERSSISKTIDEEYKKDASLVAYFLSKFILPPPVLSSPVPSPPVLSPPVLSPPVLSPPVLSPPILGGVGGGKTQEKSITKPNPKKMNVRKLADMKASQLAEQLKSQQTATQTGVLPITTTQPAESLLVSEPLFVSPQTTIETDAELWNRYFALSETKSEAEEAQKRIKEQLFERAVAQGLFNNSQTATFPCGVGKIRLAFSTKLVVPKGLVDEFYLEHENLTELVVNEKEVVRILTSEDEYAVEALTAYGFEVKTTESRTFLKQ